MMLPPANSRLIYDDDGQHQHLQPRFHVHATAPAPHPRGTEP